MHRSQLLAQIDAAFNSNRLSEGLALLRAFNDSQHGDAASWHRQAIIEEQIGESSKAGQAHYRCIESAPTNALGYLCAGYFLQQAGNEPGAAALYSLAQDVDASALALHDNTLASEPMRVRSRAGNTLLRRYLSNHHRQLCDSISGAGRIQQAHWVRTHDEATNFDSKGFAPELFYIPGVSQQRYYDWTAWSWAQQLTGNIREISEELANALAASQSQDSLRPYLSGEFAAHNKLSKLANSHNWQALDLFKEGEPNDRIVQHFPLTLKCIEAVPTYAIGDTPFEVFFSFLKPKQSIASHYGQSNHALTVHLAIDIPNGCYLEVDSEKREWHAGELLVFDDSFLHSAHNQGNRTRIVLILSVWHPDLNEAERSAVQQSFSARRNWLDARQSHLSALLEF